MEFLITKNELLNRWNLSLDNKVKWAIERYIDYVEVFGLENVFISFSGGKDSDVLCDIIDKLHSGFFEYLLEYEYIFLYNKLIKGFPPPKKVFCNTGLEFPEIIKHVKKRYPETIFLKPKIGFTKFISLYGVAVGSKKIAEQIRRLKEYLKNPTEKNLATRNLYLTGITKDGKKSNSAIPKKWLKLLDAPFEVTEKCCDNFKKEPIRDFIKKTKMKSIVGTTAEESTTRTVSYMQTGCNSFEKGKEKCRPISIFRINDIWEYSEKFNLKFCEVYYNRTVEVVQIDGTIKVQDLEAEKQTGCTFCLFGMHLEPKNKANRIQRIAISNPKYYDIIINKCGLGNVLEWLKIPYKPFKKCNKQFQLFN